jgi:hypothetical protein
MLRRAYLVVLLIATILPTTVRAFWFAKPLTYVFMGATVKPSPGPAGTAPASWIDGTAAAIMMGMVTFPIFSYDTNSTTVEQASGEIIDPFAVYAAVYPPPPLARLSESLIILSGGPLVNAPVKFYELNHATENTPVYFGTVVDSGNSYYAFFNGSTGMEITDTRAEVAPTLIIGPQGTTPMKDYFLIEVFHDAYDNKVVIVYGYSGYGTFAGALFFKNILFPGQANTLTTMTTTEYITATIELRGNTWTDGYEIVRWDDTNSNSLPDLADDYTIVHGSYVGPT